MGLSHNVPKNTPIGQELASKMNKQGKELLAEQTDNLQNTRKTYP